MRKSYSTSAILVSRQRSEGRDGRVSPNLVTSAELADCGRHSPTIVDMSDMLPCGKDCVYSGGIGVEIRDQSPRCKQCGSSRRALISTVCFMVIVGMLCGISRTGLSQDVDWLTHPYTTRSQGHTKTLGLPEAPLSKIAAAAVAHREVVICHDHSATCTHWAELGECTTNWHWMREHCTSSCGLCDSVGTELPGTRVKCVDKNAQCKYWKSIGECDINPSFLLIECPVSCGQCAAAERSSDILPESN